LKLKSRKLLSNFAFQINLLRYTTAAGASLARTHRDAVHRAYALTSIDASAARVNKGIAALAGEDTHSDSWTLLQHARSPAGAYTRRRFSSTFAHCMG
jgi:hypothetical protein